MTLENTLSSILGKLRKVKKTKSNEWKALCPAHPESTPSFTVTMKDDKILTRCFGCGANAVQVSQALDIPLKDFFSQSEGDKLNVPEERKKHIFSTAKEAVNFIQSKMGKASNRWIYEKDGKPTTVILRWNKENGEKDFRPISRCEDGWIIGAVERRGLYNVDELKKESDYVIISEGEKCADMLKDKGFTCVTNQGGSKAVQKTDWTPLKDKSVVVICDNDESGRKYAELVKYQLNGIQKDFSVIELDELEEKGEDIVEWFQLYGGTKEKLELKIKEARSSEVSWHDQLNTTKHGVVKNLMKNLSLILKNDKYFKGNLRYNELSQEMFWKDEPMEECDLNSMMMHISNVYEMDFTESLFFRGVEIECKENQFNPLVEYLSGLEWDGVKRVSNWLSTYLGSTQPMEYQEIVGKKWLVGAVARAMRPGCKMDNLLVLEGEQGIGKSTVFSILGGEFYSDSLQGVTSKDDYMLMAGKWILEVPEMGAVLRAGLAEVKAFFTRSQDEYRKPYARLMTKAKRTCVFGGTTNDDDYLRDETGSRRFWPVKCEEIDLDGLQRDVMQLWAEAYNMYQGGEVWHVNRDEAKICAAQQSSRRQTDVWEDVIMDYATLNDFRPFKLMDLMTSLDGLQMSKDRIDRRSQNRVVKSLKQMGAVKVRTHKEKMWKLCDPSIDCVPKKKSEGREESVDNQGLRPCVPKTDSNLTLESKNSNKVEQSLEPKMGHKDADVVNQQVERVPKKKSEGHKLEKSDIVIPTTEKKETHSNQSTQSGVEKNPTQKDSEGEQDNLFGRDLNVDNEWDFYNM